MKPEKPGHGDPLMWLQPTDPAFAGADPILVQSGALDLLPAYCQTLERANVSASRMIEVPAGLARLLAPSRPTPLMPARALAVKAGAGAILLKREDLAPTGSYKSGPAVAAAYFAAEDRAERVVTYSLAGNWAYAIAAAAGDLALECTIFVSSEMEATRPLLVEHCRRLGACVRAVATSTEEDIATTLLLAAVEEARLHPKARLAVGCHGNHPAIFQTLIGLEIKRQTEELDCVVDAIATAAAGGTSAVGMFAPYFDASRRPAFLVAEAAGFESLPRRRRANDQDLVDPRPVFSGLNTRCRIPAMQSLINTRRAARMAISHDEAGEAARLLSATEGIACAEETGYAIAAGLRWLGVAANTGRNLVLCISGGPETRPRYADPSRTG